MRSAATDDTWDAVWAEYDRKTVAPAAASTGLAPGRNARRLWFGLMLAPLFALLPGETRSLPAPGPWQAGVQGAVLSLARDEATMPPLAVAIARLAAESADGACFAMRLHPQGDDCARAR